MTLRSCKETKEDLQSSKESSQKYVEESSGNMRLKHTIVDCLLKTITELETVKNQLQIIEKMESKN